MNTLARFNRASAKNKRWLFIVALALITLCVWLSGDPDFKYRSPAGVLHLTQLSNDPSHWNTRADSGSATITDEGITLDLGEPAKLLVRADKSFDWDTDAAAGSKYLLVSGQLERLSDRSVISNPKHRPALSVRLRTDGSRNGTGMLVRARGDMLVENFAKLINPAPGSDLLQIYWRLFTPGQWRLNELTIRAVSTSPVYSIAMVAALVPLTIGILFVIVRLCRHLKPLQLIVLTSVAAVTITSTSLASSTMDQVRTIVLSQILSERLAGFWELHTFEVQKSGHVVVFMLITMAAFWARKRLNASYAQCFCCLLMLALLTEALQRHSIGRTPRLEDVGLDVVGMFFGYALFLGYLLIRRMLR